MPRTSAIHPPPLLFLLLFLLYFIASSFPTASAYKVLVYSASMSKSHLISNARVADALARDGHDVTLVEVEYQVPLDSLNASKLARVLRIPGKFFKLGGDGAAEAAAVDIQSMVVQLAFQRPSVRGAWNRQFMFRKFHNVFNDACKRLVTTQRWQLDLLAAEKFDLFIGEQYDFCGAGLSHALGIPTFVLVHSCPIQENIASLRGLPNPSSWVPTLQSDTSDRMSMLGRMQNLLAQMETLWWNTDIGDSSPLDPFFRQHFGADFPGVLHIVREAPFMFVNVDEFVDFPRPLFPNIVYIGGLGMEKREAETAARLEEPFRTAMAAGGSKGVVLFSLGSILRSSDLPRAFLRNIFEAFAAFPDYQFIVKAETEDNFTRQLADRICGGAGGNGTGNVLLANWLPQLELINHPRLRLFISHGGYNSLMEVARAGVPLIAMGFFGDQYRNARAAERNGWALAFDKFKLLEGNQEFKAAIARVLEEPSFTIKAKRIQRLIQTKPFSAEDRLLKSIRFLELNGGRLPELLAESRNMSTVALYNLDLLALAAICLALLLTAIRQLAKWVWRRRRSWLLIGMGGGAQKTGKRKAE